MKNIILILIVAALFVTELLAQGWVGGVPVSIQRSDYGGKHLIFIKFKDPIPAANCTHNTGVVFEDSNASSKEALTFALTALASGSEFTCYVNEDSCSTITGAAATFPVCDYYPTISK